MNRFWTILLDARVLAMIGLASLAAFLFLGAETMKIAALWAAMALAAALLLWAAIWAGRRWWVWRKARALEGAIDEQAGQATKAAPAARQREVAALRQRLQEAVTTIRGSKLGQLTGQAALYELPWYMVIGNPAAGKSTAIVKSGLHFPFTDNTGNIIQGIGGTRNCDWFFTTEGILLDTAGRYAVQEEDRQEWLGFLGLLKRHRPKAPINGILIAVSAAELAAGRPEDAITLAKSLRQRVQELTEQLEVFAPVYLVFTKADLIAGFADFFEDSDRAERERVWGATLPYEAGDQPGRADLLAQFDARFDELCDGLRDMSVARMTLQRGQPLPPGVLAFPLEFAALKPSLRAFVATLFEDNPYQFRPVFRGFYFTSAMQEGRSTSRAGERVAQQFGLRSSGGEQTTGLVVAEHGFFLRELFSKVIFADKELVRQYASRAKQRLRLGALLGSVTALALVLGALSWSYLGNRQLVASITADLDQVVKLQAERTDLASRLEALGTLQDRIEELRRHRDNPPLGLSLGLYQGDAVERRLMQEYFAGMKQVMLQPVAQSIEAYLGEVNANPGRLKPMGRVPESGAASAESAPRRAQAGGRFVDASPEDSSDAYNALKTYLMLADVARLEPNHLTDQLTRFWRGWLDDNRGAMPREQMIRAAERVITFAASNVADPAFPTVGNNLALVDAMREHLREVARGMRGVERVYADIKTRAATRFPPVTVAGLLGEADKDVVAGSYAVPGPFTREAWDGYIEEAFKQAAGSDLQSTDWVLKTTARDDLTLEGSPEQIRKQLTELYKTEYVREWQRFMQGVSVNEFGSFEQAVARMNRLGDPQQSPIRKLMNTLFDQTSWDNPSLLNERLAGAQRGFVDWFKQTILRQAPAKVEVNVRVDSATQQIPLGPIGREFAPLSRLMMSRDNQAATPMAEYLQALSKLRTRFNQIKNQGDTGPGTRALIAQTLEGGQSELTEALRFVDERMLVGMTDTARASLRPLLVRPLVQALAVAVPPAETELNRIWAAQVYEPYQRTLAGKYPFDAHARVEAAPGDVAKVFGPDGAIARFTAESLGPLVVRRGDLLEPRQWAEIGIRLKPEFAADFGGWIAPVESAMASAGGAATAGSVGTSGAAVAPAPDQTVFQVLPQGAPGVTEYTLVIDGQALRYRNTAAEWANMVWPNPAGVAGARLVAVTHEGKSVELVNEPGALGLTRLFELAQVKKLGNGVNEMIWSQGNVRVAVQLRVLRSPGDLPKPAASAATAAPGSDASPGVGQLRLRGVKLPQLVAGGAGPVGAAASGSMAGQAVSTTTATTAGTTVTTAAGVRP
jgi:type VI secretion system protein ImpL